MTDPEPVLFRLRKTLAVLMLIAQGLLFFGMLNIYGIAMLPDALALLLMLALCMAALPGSAIVLAVAGLGRSARIGGIISVGVQGAAALIVAAEEHYSLFTGHYWVLAATLIIGAVIAFVLNVRGSVLTAAFNPYALAEYPCCQHCGYNLTANVSGICPECGESI